MNSAADLVHDVDFSFTVVMKCVGVCNRIGRLQCKERIPERIALSKFIYRKPRALKTKQLTR